MADAAELVVRIRGDASDLEATISSVESELSKLEQTQSKNNNTSTKGLTAYKKQMQDAQTTLQTSRTALTNTKKAYEDNVKSVNKNVTALKAQKTELDKQISLRSNEKRLLTEANKSLDKNSVAYKDNQKALNWVNTEIEAYKKQSQSISDSIRTQEAALSGSKKAYTDAQATVKKATEQYEEYEKGLKAAERADEAQNLQNTGKRWKEVGEGIDTVTKPLQYAATALAAGGVASAKFAIDFEDNFANVKKTVDGTPEQLEKIRQEIIDMTTVGINGHSAIPETTAELTELAAAGGQLGITTDNIVDFTEVMAQMGSATNLVGEEGAATLARFQNVMGVGQNEIRNIGSAIVDLGNHSATTESEIAAMALRMGKYGSSVRMSAADVLGYSAALSSLGIEAQMGGSAIGRTWLSIETAVASGGEGLTKFAKYSGKSAEEFKKQWNTDSSGAFNGLLKGLQSAENLTLALDDLGINNTQDIQAMMALVNGYDLVTESVNRSNTAYKENTALQEEFDRKAETTASQLSVTKNNIVEAARSIGETMLPSIKDASTTVANFAKGLSQMDDEQKRAVVNTGATVIALGALSKVGVGVIKGAGDFVEGLGVISDKLPIIADATSAIKVSTAGLGSSFSALAPIFGAVLAPAAVVAGYKVIADHVTEAIENNAKLGQSYKELYSQWQDADNQVSHLENLRSEYEKLNESINSGTLNPEELESAKNRINDIMQEIKATTNDDTIKLMIDTGEFDTALAMAVSNAQDSANEIKDALDLTSGKKAQKAVSEGYDALQKGSSYGMDYKNQKEEMSQWLQQATDVKEKYQQLQEEMTAAYASGDKERRQKAIQARDAFVNEMTDSEFSKAYEKMQGQKFSFGEMKDVQKQVDNIKAAYNEISTSIEKMDERANNGRESLQAVAEVVTSESMNLNGFKNMQEVFESGGIAVDNVCKQIKSTMTDLGFENQDIAAQVALFKNGFQDLQGAINNNALDAVVNDFVKQGKEIGLTSEEIVTKAALMKNGFSDIQQAVASGDVSGLVKDLSSLGGDLGLSTEQVDALAHSLGLLPEDKHIEIDASGDVSAIENAKNAVEEINNAGNVQLQVSAEGDISVLDTADSKLQELINNNQVTITFNVDTGGFDINDLNGNKLGEITATGKVIWTNDSTEPDNYTAPPKEGNVTFKKNSAEPDGYQPEDKFATVHYTVSVEGSSIEGLSDKSAPAARFGSTGTFVKKKVAKGTQNFEGGLAMVNDEKGISDPRELIVDKGRAFIPQGKDVVLPLSKGAKVYTASQTKAIMNGMGIPHYATGKDNSDAFTSAKDDWTHYTKTHAVTTAQELEKWLEFQEKFKSNDKDIADIEEQIFSLTQKRTQELNNLSKSYIEERAALNDWDDNGDNPIDAFARIRDRNMAEVEAGRMTWEDYTTEMSSIGSTLYENMTEYSRDWLEHQEKYNGMSAADYIAGIGRIQTYTEQMYAQGIISHKEYVEAKNKLNEEYLDKRKEQIEQEYNISKDYISEHTYFNDWQDNGDNPLDAYNRVMDRHREELANGELTQDEFDKYQSELGSDMYSERVEQSKNWLEEQRKYYGMTDEEYIAGLKRIQQYTQEYYDLGLISRKEYNENMTELNHDMFDQAGESFDDMLQQQQDYINKLRDEFSAQEQALQDSWTVEDRKADMSETQAQLDIYANAVTDRGQQKYKELQEQMKQLQRDEELYQLQVKNNATIEKLEAEYDALENSKADFIKSIATNIDSIDVTGIVADITQEVSGGNDKITKTLGEIIEAIKGIKIEQQNYNNNSKITINTTDSAVLGSYV
nr:MAG TPA: minor tail protein [Caudoviricetes sp.]